MRRCANWPRPLLQSPRHAARAFWMRQPPFRQVRPTASIPMRPAPTCSARRSRTSFAAWVMSADKSHWEAVYETKPANTVSWFQQTPERSLALIRQVAPDVTEPIIDVGGGASVLVDE